MMTRHRSHVLRTVRSCFVAAFCAMNSHVGAGTDEPSFIGLGTLPGGLTSEALGVSDDGLVVVGVSDTETGVAHAFRWTLETGMVDLGTLPGATYSYATGTSADGSVVVGSCGDLSSGEVAFRWTAKDGMVSLGTLPSESTSEARGVSDDGSVIVGTSGNFAYRWTEHEGMVSLGALPGEMSSGATGVSADGSVIVGGSGSFAYRWTEQNGMESIGSSGGDCSTVGTSASAVSGNGLALVGHISSIWLGGCGTPDTVIYSESAIRWTGEEGITALSSVVLGVPGFSIAVVRAINDDGSIMVGNDPTSPAVWNASGFVILFDQYLAQSEIDLTGWTFAESNGWFPTVPPATGVSADGSTIVGSAFHDGLAEAWLANVDLTFAQADLNHDGFVNQEDLAQLLANWGDVCPYIWCGDFNGDGVVGPADLAELLANWSS